MKQTKQFFLESETLTLSQNWFMWKKKFVYVLNYSKTFKAVHKNNPRRHSPQQNKKAVLKTATCFKVSTPVKSQGQ